MPTTNAYPRWLHFLVCLILFGAGVYVIPLECPMLLRLERAGTKMEGILVRYENTGGRHSSYTPIVALNDNGTIREVRGRSTWWWRWYDVGESVTVLELHGVEPAIGGFAYRWGEISLLGVLSAIAGVYVISGLAKFIRALLSIRV